MKLAKRKHAIRAALIAGMDDLAIELIQQWNYKLHCWHELVWLRGATCSNDALCPGHVGCCSFGATAMQMRIETVWKTIGIEFHCELGRNCKFWKRAHK